jgi:hypothetical protein
MNGSDTCGYCHVIGIDSLGNVHTRVDQTGFSIQVVPFNFNSVVQVALPSFTISPNPANDNVVLHGNPGNDAVQVNIINVFGQRVLASTAIFNNGSAELPLNSVSAGYYIVEVVAKSGFTRLPLVVQSK